MDNADTYSGKVIHGYKLHEHLGRGTFTISYRAHQVSLNRDVIVKFLLPEYAQQPDYIQSFNTEVQLFAQLRNPHIVPLVDHWIRPKRAEACLVTQYLSGPGMPDAIRNQRWAAEPTVKVLEQMAGALGAVHSAGVVHGHLRLSNFVLDEHANAYLMHFGTIGFQDAVDRNGKGTWKKSLPYMAPERLEGKPVSFQTDIYSLGIMLFEILTGVQPFSGTDDEVVRQHLYEPLPPLHLYRADLPVRISDILRIATAKNPQDRYPDTARLAQEFRAAYNGGETTAVDQSGPSTDSIGVLLVGHKLGNYQIEEFIGIGGMSLVYRGRDVGLGREVAVKVLPPQYVDDGKWRTRFEREAMTIARLSHENIVKVYSNGNFHDIFYIAMEFIDGIDLSKYLSIRKTLTLDEAIIIVRQVANALDYAHSQNVIHRDVKPANVMLPGMKAAAASAIEPIKPSCKVVLMDFGIARPLIGTNLTQGISGTPAYMAPEQFDALADTSLETGADIYALGVMTYEMLIGKMPFTQNEPLQLGRAHSDQPPYNPYDLRPDLPVNVVGAIMKALAKKPSDRFQTAGEFAAALDS